MEIRNIIEKIAKEKEGKGGIQNVVWVAAGGSNGGNYPAQYFMDREAKSIPVSYTHLDVYKRQGIRR